MGKTFGRMFTESLQNQSYKNFEHIVIDGGSTDRTLEIINNHKSKIKFFFITKR